MTDGRVESLEASTGRIVVGRILPSTDLMTGLLQICQDNDVQCGSVIALIGSLAKAQFVYAIPDRHATIGIMYSQPVEIDGPLEFLSGQGIIGIGDSGETIIHLHCLVSDHNMKVYGGHFTTTGNPVLATIEAVIQEFKHTEIIRSFDEETGFSLFKLLKRGKENGRVVINYSEKVTGEAQRFCWVRTGRQVARSDGVFNSNE